MQKFHLISLSRFNKDRFSNLITNNGEIPYILVYGLT